MPGIKVCPWCINGTSGMIIQLGILTAIVSMVAIGMWLGLGTGGFSDVAVDVDSGNIVDADGTILPDTDMDHVVFKSEETQMGDIKVQKTSTEIGTSMGLITTAGILGTGQLGLLHNKRGWEAGSTLLYGGSGLTLLILCLVFIAIGGIPGTHAACFDYSYQGGRRPWLAIIMAVALAIPACLMWLGVHRTVVRPQQEDEEVAPDVPGQAGNQQDNAPTELVQVMGRGEKGGKPLQPTGGIGVDPTTPTDVRRLMSVETNTSPLSKLFLILLVVAVLLPLAVMFLETLDTLREQAAAQRKPSKIHV